MSEEVNIIDVSTVKQQELPFVLASQFDQLAILETNVQKAVNMAIEAKNKAQNAKVKMGLLDYSKKEAINLLQLASEGLAEGLMTAAEAQKVSFEYQTKLTEITKFLFGLGVSNLAMNRSVVRELELKLRGASEEEISDLAKQELKNVILQLKAQQDIMKKQDDLTGKVKIHHNRLDDIDRQLYIMDKSDQEQYERQEQKDFENDLQIKELKKQNSEQNKLIATHSERLLKYDKAFEEFQKKMISFEQKCCDNTDKIKGLESSLKQQEQALTKKNSELDERYADTTKQLRDELFNLIYTANKDSKIVKEDIFSVLEDVGTNISLVKEDLSKAEDDLLNTVNVVEEKLISVIDDLKEEASNKNKEFYNQFTDLKDKINSIDIVTSKSGWKIGISVVAVGSLILNILQICGIL